MTRVWLSGWEWACCGDPFQVGSEVDFGIASRHADWLVEALGADLAATVDGVESHHEEEFPDRVIGTVTAVHAVVQEYVERRELRRPGHGAPPDAVMPPDGQEWPGTRREIASGVIIGTQPSRYMIAREPVPGGVTLRPVPGVRRPRDEEAPEGAAEPRPPASDPPPERRVTSLSGWLVDVDEK